MASDLQTPGVYIEEVRTLPASVAQVATAVPAFMGNTARRPGEDPVVVARVTSLPEYERLFGGPEPLSASVDTTADIAVSELNPKYLMHPSVQLYFLNGGGPCYIVSCGTYDAPANLASFRAGLTALTREDEPTLLAVPDGSTLNRAADLYNFYQEALAHCEYMQDRFLLLDTYNTGDTSIADFRNNTGSQALKYGAAYYPHLHSNIPVAYDEALVTITQGSGDEATTATLDSLAEQDNAQYNRIKAVLDGRTYTLPPSGAIAGVYARVDANEGVWKAPANVSLSGVYGPNLKITNADQDTMNVDPASGKSVNAIRAFTGKGTLVWGARTLAGNDNEWRYVPVRRLFITVEESIKKATEFVVFEPNDANTWVRVSAMIENYLTDLWKDGALAGARADDAFFVRVGLGHTMTAEDVLAGRMIIKIGLAAVRPAEFIVLQFSHQLQKS